MLQVAGNGAMLKQTAIVIRQTKMIGFTSNQMSCYNRVFSNEYRVTSIAILTSTNNILFSQCIYRYFALCYVDVRECTYIC
jgi:hypothetical protein